MVDERGTGGTSRRARDRGFTLVEILISVVLVGIVSAVVVVGVEHLTTQGADAACLASRDAARAAAGVHLGSTGSYPASMAVMVGATELVLPSNVNLDVAGTTASSSDGWTLTMVAGNPPSFSCGSGVAVAAPTTSVAATTTTAPPATIAPPTTTLPPVPLVCNPAPGAVTICAGRSDGTAVPGVSVLFSRNGNPWTTIGSTGTDGLVTTSTNGTGTIRYTIGGASMEVPSASLVPGATVRVTLTRMTVQLRDPSGAAVSDGSGSVFYYGNQGQWQYSSGSTPWVTDGSGQVLLDVLPVPGYTVRLVHHGAAQELSVNAATQSGPVVFQLARLTVQLRDPSGAAVTDGQGQVLYYGNQGQWQYASPRSAWSVDSSGQVLLDVLPVPGYTVRLVHHGAAQEMSVDASSQSGPVVFQLVRLTVQLQSSTSAAIVDGRGQVLYYGNQGQWRYSTGTTPWTVSASGQVLLDVLPVPGYTVRMVYGGAAQELAVNAATQSGPVVFRTAHISVQLSGSSGVAVADGQGRVLYYGNQGQWQYASGSTPWTVDGVGQVGLELLQVPGYTVRMVYRGAAQELSLDASTSSGTLRFQLARVSIAVSVGGVPSDAATIVYYGNQGQWQPAVPTSGGAASIDLLAVPGWTVRAAKGSTSIEHGVDASLPNPSVAFAF